jgi:hypothetical protein
MRPIYLPTSLRLVSFSAKSPNYGLEIHIAGGFATATVAKPAKNDLMLDPCEGADREA